MGGWKSVGELPEFPRESLLFKMKVTELLLIKTSKQRTELGYFFKCGNMIPLFRTNKGQEIKFANILAWHEIPE